jgi:hypothetical protein
MNLLQYTVLCGLLFGPVFADWQFRSRPDLSPPRLNITVPAHSSVEAGLIFVAPYENFEGVAWGPEQPGAYIFRDNGDLVWSGLGYFGGWIANFQAGKWQGKPVLHAFEGRLDHSHGRMYGKHSILNDRYETVKVVRSGSHRLVSAHEFRILESGSVLIETPVSIPTNLSRWGGDQNQNWIVSNGFQGACYRDRVIPQADLGQRSISQRETCSSSGIVSTT